MDISEYIDTSVALPISAGVAPPEKLKTSLFNEIPLFLGNTRCRREKVLRGRVMVRESGRNLLGGGSIGARGAKTSGGKKISLAKIVDSLFNR